MAKFTLPDVNAATKEFSRIMREWLTDAEMAAVRAGRADVDDYCDSNMAVLEAVEKLAPGFESQMDFNQEEQCELFNAMWEKAKEQGYA